MAAKKKVSTKTTGKGLATRKPSNIVDIDAQLAKDAEGIVNQIGAPSTNKIRTKDKMFTMPDGFIERDSLQLVIIDFNSQNKFYSGVYDANNVVPPDCFAISSTPKNMVPSKSVANPECDNCDECPNNAFGSSGAGKACKNTRVLVVTTPDAGPDDELMTLEVSPTALRGFDAYVTKIAKDFSAPPVKVITTVSFHDTKPMLVFSDPEPNPNYAEHYARRDEARAILSVEPDLTALPAPSKKKRAGGRR